MKKILLSQTSKTLKGKYFTTVDNEDYEKLIKFQWRAAKAKGINKNGDKNFRVMKNKTKDNRFNYMHRMIMNVTDPNIWVDHKDRNPLNNRRKNLRLCNAQESACNIVRKKRTVNNVSKYRGVYWCERDKKWRSFFNSLGKHIWVGRFDTENEAAKAYNKAIKKHHGEFAVLNKIIK